MKVSRTTEQKLRTKLRLTIGHITLKSIVKNPPANWEPTTPIIPCEWDRPVGEVREVARKYLDDGHARVLVPVLYEPVIGDDEIKVTISYSFVSNHQECCGESSSETISDMDPSVTMQVLSETMDPSKKWDISELDEYELLGLADMV